jgi:hypothetical protein
MAPVKDRMLFDLFTTALNENAARGQLSINQTNLAAWSAVLSGVTVLTNATTGQSTVIQPASLSPRVSDMVQAINRTRSATVGTNEVFPNKLFGHLGDILAVPELTDKSPFLTNNIAGVIIADPSDINDEVMERIPQQIMSLLTLSHTPRFVIYAYGQTLHPAPNSIVTASGSFFNMCTNYQVTAETATRAVVRVDGFNTTNGVPAPHIVVEQFNVLPPD